MPIGTVAADVFEKEDGEGWVFNSIDARITDITGWTITGVIKASILATGSPLLSLTATQTGPTSFTVDTFNVNLAPGTYYYSFRRVDVGHVKQLAQGTFTVAASAHVTH